MAKRRAPQQPEALAEKFPPESPEARDEGPRLIPLTPHHYAIDNSWGLHALELADIALGIAKPKDPAKKFKRVKT